MSGWKSMNYRPSLMLSLMMLIYTPIYAESDEKPEIPSPEFLEFLGEWETTDGEWVDPNEFGDEDLARLLTITDEENE